MSLILASGKIFGGELRCGGADYVRIPLTKNLPTCIAAEPDLKRNSQVDGLLRECVEHQCIGYQKDRARRRVVGVVDVSLDE